MPDFRVYHRPVAGDLATAAPTELRLDADESHHLVTVNRARVGDPVTAFDGRGKEWLCELAATHKREAVLRVRSASTRPPLPCAVTLGQALPKGGVMDDIVRHATELGAARISPLNTDRVQLRLDSDRSDKKTDKWRVIALEACKQCGNPFLPEIAAPASLGDFLAAVRGHELKLVASLHPGTTTLGEAVARVRASLGGRPPASAAWLIGPEGDLTTDEVSAALAAGFLPVTLGPLVLRCDTAATAALAMLNGELAP